MFDELSMPATVLVVASFAAQQLAIFPEFRKPALYAAVGGPTFALICLFFKLRFSDPGEMQTAPGRARKRMDPEEVQKLLQTPAERMTMRLMDGEIEVIGYRCRTCGHMRAPGTHHSRLTDRCCVLFDHYCYFVRNDIGQANMKAFVRLLRCVQTYCVCTSLVIILDLALVLEHAKRDRVSVVLYQLFFCVVYFVVSLLGSLKVRTALADVKEPEKIELLRSTLMTHSLTKESVARLISMSQEDVERKLNPEGLSLEEIRRQLKGPRAEWAAWTLTLLRACCDH